MRYAEVINSSLIPEQMAHRSGVDFPAPTFRVDCTLLQTDPKNLFFDKRKKSSGAISFFVDLRINTMHELFSRSF